MQLVKSLFYISLLFLIGTQGAFSQAAVTSAGGSAAGDNGNIQFSVGQIFFNQISGSGGTGLQGVQQPYEIYVITGAAENYTDYKYLSIFPNPADDYLIISVQQKNNKAFSFELYDIEGKMRKKGHIKGEEIKIHLNDLLPSTYFVRIFENKKLVKAYKIIKK